MPHSTTNGFVHLHLHSEYSLLDGGNRISRLIDHVKSLDMTSVAVTDHGNLFGAVEFYKKATEAGIKPILGIEAYVALGDRTEKVKTGIKDGGFHLVLLAENETGWKNLLKLSSDSFINGFYYKPRMDKSTLEAYSDGLIAINGHLGSSLAHHLLEYVKTGHDNHYQNAIEEAKWHAKTFGKNDNGEPSFYVELQRNEVEEQERINPHLVRLASELDLPLVCDNDAHFMTAADHDVHDTLCCISMQKFKDETDRLRYPKALYVKSHDEMSSLFSEHPDAIENTAKIANRCQVDIDFTANHAPVVKIVYAGGNETLPTTTDEAVAFVDAFQSDHAIGSLDWYNEFCSQFTLEPFDETNDTESADDLKERCDGALRVLSEAGAIWRYGRDGVNQEKRERLDRELQILADKLISAYFLIVWDFVNWARQQHIPANARGSGVGTIVGYVLGLSNACPVEYGLLFERFTDPDRSEYPDIDVDICQNGRAEVIQYVRDKYGHVAQIITFGRLKAKAAVKDVARVMGMSPTDGQRLSNLIPNELNITIDEALSKAEDFKKAYDSDEKVKVTVDHARSLENHARHAGVHAAGVVIATQPLDNIVPLYKASGSDDIVTQWDGPTCEKVGLLKMDFLGLRTLSTIERAKKLIRESLSEEAIRAAVIDEHEQSPNHQIAQSPNDSEPSPQPSPSGRGNQTDPLDLDRLTYDDQRVLDIFRRGDTKGIFQFESGGMRQLLMDMQPDRLEDLIAANALYRPGPMDLIPDYNARKHGRESVPSVHPIVDDFTRETYGIMIYQEQVMQIVHSLGDIPLREAYSLIKAISKKKESVINAARPRFVTNAKKKGLSKKQAEDLFDLILKFAGYGFNKSHSTGYAIIAYQTAYLKTYFPAQYMAAVLTFESQAKKVEDWVPYLEGCKQTRYPDHTDDHPNVGLLVKPPDINLSDADFTVVFKDDEPRDHLHGHIRFGLSALKGAGNSAINGIITEREKDGEFESIFDFCERVDSRSVNKSTLEALIKCGAFDSVHGIEARSSLCASLEDAMRAGQSAARDRKAGQGTFFDSFAEATPAAEENNDIMLSNIPAWTDQQALTFEKEVLGFHASGHPLDAHEKTLTQFNSHTISQLLEAQAEQPVLIGGILSGVRVSLVRKGRSAGQKMAWLNLQDKTGSIEAVCFSDAFTTNAPLLQDDNLVMVLGKVDRRRGEPSLVIDKAVTLDAAPRHFTGRVDIRFTPNDDAAKNEHVLTALHDSLQASATTSNSNGVRPADVFLHVHTQKQIITIRPGMLRIAVDPPLLTKLHAIVGEDNVRLGCIPISMLTFQRSGNSNGKNNWQRKQPTSNGAPQQSNGHDNGTLNEPAETCASIDRY